MTRPSASNDTSLEKDSAKPKEGASRVRTTMKLGKTVTRSELPVSTVPHSETIGDTSEIVRIAQTLPTIDVMRPEPNARKVFADKGVDIRQFSFGEHQDGVAYNPDTKIGVVCDGMGGTGSGGTNGETIKNNLGWALAHSVAAVGDLKKLSDITELSGAIAAVPELMESRGVDMSISTSTIRSKMHKGLEAGSTIAAVQQVEKNTWQALTYGDSSVLVIGADNQVKHGFGESYQAWTRTGKSFSTVVEDGPMSSSVGLTQGTLQPAIEDSGRNGFRAEFGEFTVEAGDRVVVASDAYVQKSTMDQLIAEINMPAESWNERHTDDTTLVIIDPMQFAVAE